MLGLNSLQINTIGCNLLADFESRSPAPVPRSRGTARFGPQDAILRADLTTSIDAKAIKISICAALSWETSPPTCRSGQGSGWLSHYGARSVRQLIRGSYAVRTERMITLAPVGAEHKLLDQSMPALVRLITRDVAGISMAH